MTCNTYLVLERVSRLLMNKTDCAMMSTFFLKRTDISVTCLFERDRFRDSVQNLLQQRTAVYIAQCSFAN